MDNELTVTAADLMAYLEEIPPTTVIKVKDDVGELDPVIVWVPINLRQVNFTDGEVRIG